MLQLNYGHTEEGSCNATTNSTALTMKPLCFLCALNTVTLNYDFICTRMDTSDNTEYFAYKMPQSLAWKLLTRRGISTR